MQDVRAGVGELAAQLVEGAQVLHRGRVAAAAAARRRVKVGALGLCVVGGAGVAHGRADRLRRAAVPAARLGPLGLHPLGLALAQGRHAAAAVRVLIVRHPPLKLPYPGSEGRDQGRVGGVVPVRQLREPALGVREGRLVPFRPVPKARHVGPRRRGGGGGLGSRRRLPLGCQGDRPFQVVLDAGQRAGQPGNLAAQRPALLAERLGEFHRKAVRAARANHVCLRSAARQVPHTAPSRALRMSRRMSSIVDRMAQACSPGIAPSGHGSPPLLSYEVRSPLP